MADDHVLNLIRAVKDPGVIVTRDPGERPQAHIRRAVLHVLDAAVPPRAGSQVWTMPEEPGPEADRDTFAIRGAYEDSRWLRIEPSINGEVTVRIDDGEPMFFNGGWLLTMVHLAVDEAMAALEPVREATDGPT